MEKFLGNTISNRKDSQSIWT